MSGSQGFKGRGEKLLELAFVASQIGAMDGFWPPRSGLKVRKDAQSFRRCEVILNALITRNSVYG